jgi:hypothetical protein
LFRFITKAGVINFKTLGLLKSKKAAKVNCNTKDILKRGIRLFFGLLGLSLITFSSHSQTITFYKDIALIINKNCSICHRTGEDAPFALESYEEVKNRAKSIAYVLEKGTMPPWKPDPAYSHLAGERILSAQNKKLITDWINDGCAQGDKNDYDNTSFASFSLSEGESDLVLRLPFSVHIVPNMYDTIVYLEMPYEIEKDTFVSSYQFFSSFHSDYKRGIHHVFFAVEDIEHTGAEAAIEQYDEGEYWDGKSFHHRKYTTQYTALAGGWVPGVPPTTMPEGIGFRLPKKGMVIFRVHYGPTTRAYDNTFELRLKFPNKLITRFAEGKKLGYNGGIVNPYPPLVIPPDSIMTFQLNMVTKEDFSLIAMAPHMHLLGKSFKVWFIKPNGDTVHLIYIHDWDFNWQGYYSPLRLLKIDSGSVIHADVIYNNTANNIRNPNNPPKFVKFGQRTKDEMLEFNFYSVPYKKGDEFLNIGNN